MVVLTCTRDGTENLPQALSCTQCGRRLSRVKPGSVFIERYRVLELLRETEFGFYYLVELDGRRCTLLEIIPKSVLPTNSLISFDRAGQRLKDLHPRCLPSVLEYFAIRSCFYVVEAMPQGKILRERIQEDGPWPEDRAHALLEGLLSNLQELYSATPPLYVGAMSTDNIVVNGAGPPVFLETRWFSDAVLDSSASSIRGYFAKDLSGCAQAVVSALAGDPGPATQQIGTVIAGLQDLAFGCTLDWILRPKGKEPASLGQLNQFRGLIVQARAAEKRGELSKAVELLNHALHIVRSRRLEAVLEELEKLKQAQVQQIQEQPQPEQVQPAARNKDRPKAPPIVPGPPPEIKPETIKTGQGKQDDGRSIHQPVQVPAQTRDGRQARSRSGVLLVAAVLLSLVVVGWIWISGAQMRNFNNAIARKQLLTPSGASAYDIWKQAVVADGLNSSTVQEMNSKASPVLHEVSDQQFTRWYQNSDLSAAQWEELAKAEDWLVSINSNDTTSQARKAYADAELTFKRRQYADALNGFEQAFQRFPNWNLAAMGIGKACFELKRYDCSERYYLRAEQIEPAWLWPHRNLMELYISPERRNVLAACGEYKQLIDLSSSMNPPPFKREAVQKKMDPICQDLSQVR